jgi:large subunit ribosomal protein L20
MNWLSKAGLALDRKVLADLALNQPEDFTALVEQARTAANS